MSNNFVLSFSKISFDTLQMFLLFPLVTKVEGIVLPRDTVGFWRVPQLFHSPPNVIMGWSMLTSPLQLPSALSVTFLFVCKTPRWHIAPVSKFFRPWVLWIRPKNKKKTWRLISSIIHQRTVIGYCKFLGMLPKWSFEKEVPNYFHKSVTWSVSS